MSARKYWEAAASVDLPARKVGFFKAAKALFMLATYHRRYWGERGRWGRENPFRAYDRANPPTPGADGGG
jgi:hypothetical protein